MTKSEQADFDPYVLPPLSEAELKKAKAKAKELKSSQWWKRKISAGICYYCRKKFLPSELTMDHVIPLSRGGRTEKSNIVACCKDCNNQKKYLLPAEWTEYLDRLTPTPKKESQVEIGEQK